MDGRSGLDVSSEAIVDGINEAITRGLCCHEFPGCNIRLDLRLKEAA
jgi:hypothetical protein